MRKNEARWAAKAAGQTTYEGVPCIHGHSGLRYSSSSSCVECHKVKNAHPEARAYRVNWGRAANRKAYHKYRHMKLKYGIDQETYESLHREQQGACLICKEVKTLVVDHCHTNGHVRGLLCGNCNTGIGMLQESESILLAAISYIKEHKK